MPKLHEKERKINLLKHGENVRPPYFWWYKMLPKIEKQYPEYDKTESEQVLGGIWNNYDVETKIKIVKEYQNNNIQDFQEHKHRDEIGRL